MSAMLELLDTLNLEPLEHNLFRGRSPNLQWQRVFGGQTIAQSLVAAQKTVPLDRFVHSLHGYFLRPGDTRRPVLYEVDRIRDGGSFNTRRVTAIQHGQAIFSLEASFQVVESGLHHQIAMPLDVPPPEALISQTEIVASFGDAAPPHISRFWDANHAFEMRPVVVDHYTSKTKLEPRQRVWLRFIGDVPQEKPIKAAMLAYISDVTLLDTSTFAHGRAVFDPDIMSASLDHAMWFHNDHPLDGWLLYTHDSPSSSGGRGFSRGAIYAREGTLIASVAQEGLIRLRTDA